MSASKFKTLRHIETVRNFLSTVVVELLQRGSAHDQTKLQSPEVEVFEEVTPRLRSCTYGSAEYSTHLGEMHDALGHHYAHNRHHPEYFSGDSPLAQMTLVDLTEMVCDWRAASLRHADGDVMKSIDINQKRFGYSDEVAKILRNTVAWLDEQKTEHYAEES